jgi:phosphate starvation-inducible PhoH-like protein
MRGRTFKRSFIIADEMQNSSPNQMKMMLTRLGEHSRMAVTGDLKQSDRGENNGLADFMKKWKKYDFLC